MQNAGSAASDEPSNRPMLKAAWAGSSTYDVPGMRAPKVMVAPGMTGPR